MSNLGERLSLLENTHVIRACHIFLISPSLSLYLFIFFLFFIFLSLSLGMSRTQTHHTRATCSDAAIDHFTDQLDVSTEAAVFRARTWRWRSSNSCRLSTWLLAARGPWLEYERRGSITLRAENRTDCGKRGRQVVTLTADNAVRTLRPRGAKCADWSL